MSAAAPALRVLSLIPPMTQLNTPYPSTAYLTGFLRSRGIPAAQRDLALALVLKLFSRDGLRRVRAAVQAIPLPDRGIASRHFDEDFDRYLATITPVIAFLQGRDPTLAHRINTRTFLPEGSRFGQPERSELLDVFRGAAEHFYDSQTAFRVFYSVRKH